MAEATSPNQRQIRHQMPTPPYISFLRLKAFLQMLQHAGIPDRFDLEFFSTIAPADRRQLLTALQYLQLVDAFWRPAEDLGKIVTAYGTETWPAELGRVLERAYRPVFEHSPFSSPDDVADVFRALYEGTDDVLRKSRTFFLHAAHEADKVLNPAVFSGIKRRMVPATRPRPDPRRASPGEETTHTPQPWAERQESDANQRQGIKPSIVLLELWDTERMTFEEEKAIQTLLKYCKRHGI